MKKYIDDPKKGKPIYDLIAQKREGEIYTKFPQRSARDAAKNFKSPLNDLSVKDTLQNDMGISPSSFSDNNISNISKIVKNKGVKDVLSDKLLTVVCQEVVWAALPALQLSPTIRMLC